MPSVLDVPTPGGRRLRVHDTGAVLGGAPALVWHTGSPQTGALLDPLVAATSARGIRLVSYGRPSYGGSSADRGRRVASAAADVRAIAGALGLERFAVMGASGGGPHALACAALLPDRVTAAVSISGLAPYTGEDDWFAGMAAPEALRAAAEGPRPASDTPRSRRSSRSRSRRPTGPRSRTGGPRSAATPGRRGRRAPRA